MGVWRSYENKYGHFTARHFKHIGDAGGCSGGESDDHLRMKEIALHKLQWELEKKLGIELAILTDEYRIGDGDSGYHAADVFCEFKDPRFPQGKGIIIEVQFKNEQKDIEAVSEYYLRNGYSVYWVWPEQFDDRDVDLLGGDVRMVWPDAIPEPNEWNDGLAPLNDAESLLVDLRGRIEATEAQERIKHIPATLPSEWNDLQAQSIWRETDWVDLFSPPEDYLDIWCYAKVPATLPPEWHQKTAREFWRNEAWIERFWLSWQERFNPLVDHTAKPSIKACPPFGEWIRKGPIDGRYRQILEAYHRYGMDGTAPTQIKKREKEVAQSLPRNQRRVFNIIRYNTGDPQSPSIALENIKVVAMHGGIGPQEVESALESLIMAGHIETTDPREFRIA